MNEVRIFETWGSEKECPWGLTDIFINMSSISFSAWVSYLNIGVLIGTLALALFNASKDDVAKNFAYFYAAVSVGIIVRVIVSR